MTSHEDDSQKMEIDPIEKLCLMSNDKKIFVVDKDTIHCLCMIKDMMDNLKLTYNSVTANEPLFLANVDGETLEAVIKWSKKHKNDTSMSHETPSYNELSRWDKDFIKGFKGQQLEHLLNAASYLDVKSLLNACCNVIAKDLEKASIKEIRERFNIKSDFSEEEERQLAQESSRIGLDQ